MDDTSKYNSFREQWPRFFIMNIIEEQRIAIEEQRERILLQKEEIERLNNKMKCVS
tara:strand:+ start:1677 stop:1844 length:168 start_codon:yes stop_codon:yes gene_type:complete